MAMNYPRRCGWVYRRAVRVGMLAAAVSPLAAIHVHAMGYASLTCKELFEHKDRIYYDNGYCLADSEAAARGDKGLCRIEKLADVVFANADLQNLMLIARNEERKKCPNATLAPSGLPAKN